MTWLRVLHDAAPLNVGIWECTPGGWSGRWDIDETIRKVYVTIEGI